MLVASNLPNSAVFFLKKRFLLLVCTVFLRNVIVDILYLYCWLYLETFLQLTGSIHYMGGVVTVTFRLRTKDYGINADKHNDI